MTIDLTKKTVLVTGATRGIGKAVALAMAGAGANVVACARSGGEKAEELERNLKDIGVEHVVTQTDVSEPDQVRELMLTVQQRFGQLDVIVNNAGTISHIPFGELSLPEWHRVIDNNLTAAFLVSQAALPLLGRPASIINIGSRSADAGIPLRSHYTAAKAGLVGLTKSMAKELGGRGVRVNVIAPGVIDTDEDGRIPEDQRKAIVARYSAMTAIGRLGESAEIAGAALFLASDLSSYVTGQTINVDGGI